MSKPSPHEHVSTRRSTSQSTLPRPCTVPSSEFSLDGVPDLYIVSQLHRFAGNYWNKPETADCTVVVVPKNMGSQHPDSDDHSSAQVDAPPASGSSNDPSRRPKRRSGPPKMVFKLHQQYLSVQSTLLRSVLQGTRQSVPPALPNPANDDRRQSRSQIHSPFPPSGSAHHSVRPAASTVNPTRTPCILPSSRPNHPIIYLPVPDPASIPHLVYYMYFGTFNHIEDSLQKGALTWQNIVQNVEYLGMRVEIKAALGRYHRIWMKPTSTPAPSDYVEEKDESSDSNEGEDHSDIDAPSREAVKGNNG